MNFLLTLRRPVLLKIMRELQLRMVSDTLQLIRLSDGSFLVGYKSDIGEKPDMLIGCIGKWVNTDSLEWAEDVFGALARVAMERKHSDYSVTDCIAWRSLLEAEVCYGARH
jgi:hypothetical protein